MMSFNLNINNKIAPTIIIKAVAGARHNMPSPRTWPWPLTFWSWKWCPSHVWRGLPLYQF